MTYLQLCLLLLFALALAEAECPEKCSCTETSILCVNKNFETVPNFALLTTTPYIVDLSGNKISFISSQDFNFNQNDAIKEIYLNNTQLVEIDSQTFTKMESLQELYLGNNLLDSVPEDIIEGLDYMVLLDFSGNRFEGDMPTINSRYLEVLIMINCEITALSENALKSLPNLRLLSLEQNNIHQMDINLFEAVPNKYFLLKISYNPWICTCETIKLFNYLADNNYIATNDPYECTTNNNIIKIYESTNLQTELCQTINTNAQQEISIDQYSVVQNVSTHKIIPIENWTQVDFYNTSITDVIKEEEVTYIVTYIFLALLTLTGIFFLLILHSLFDLNFKHINTSDSVTKLI